MGLRHLRHDLVQIERRRFLTRRKLHEPLDLLRHQRLHRIQLRDVIDSKDKLIEQFKKSTGQLARWLGDIHAHSHMLLSWMERAQGNIPPELQKLIKETRENLTLRQNAFLKEYGDYAEPGVN